MCTTSTGCCSATRPACTARSSSTCRSAAPPRRRPSAGSRGWPTRASATSSRRSSRACSTTRRAGSTPISTSGAPARTCCRWRPTCRSTWRSPASRSGRSTARSRSGRKTDSVSLGLLEAITPAVNRVGGSLKADVQVGGTWSAPRLAGAIDIHGGSMSLPGLGVRFGGGPTAARSSKATRCGCTMWCSPAAAAGSRSAARCGWRTSRARSSTSTFKANQFRALDVRSFLTLVGTGDLELRGPVFGATLTGGLLANSGVLYFADLVNKRIIDLEDPSIADLVDTTLIRRENLGAKFQNRFLDSLRIEDLRVEMGSDVWLRSAEANIQLEGRMRREQAGADVQSDRHAERAARHLHAQGRPRQPRLHGDSRPGELHRRPQRRARHRGAIHGAQYPRRRDPGHRERHRHAVSAQAHAREHASGRRSPRPTSSRTSSPGTRPTRPPCSGGSASRPAWPTSRAPSRASSSAP